ncbi:MAG: lipase family protein [Planctomycetota bacterium]
MRTTSLLAALVAASCAWAQDVLPEPARTYEALYSFSREHPFFRYAPGRPFRARGDTTDPVNVAYLAELELLTYYATTFQKETLEAHGFRDVVNLTTSLGECLVADRDGATLVAFKGTTFERLSYVARNLKGWRSEARAGGGVHAGFKECLDSLWPKLRQTLAARSKPVWLTGHSLGGALAVIAGTRLPRVQGVVTFGTPRVGNQAFADGLRIPCARYVNGRDGIPHMLPAWLGYRHAGRVRYLSASGVSRDAPRGSWSRRLAWLAPLTIPGAPGASLPSWFLDHAMLGYAIRTSNALLRGRAGVAGRLP